MEGQRLTEERLRHHLDSNQMLRERMCLALLPLLGPYTREQPRRPKGGPDGGRDIEAVYQGQTLVWGAVGFRNGGGQDEDARKAAEEKFREDVDRALGENASLPAFVFFTNVDLTPGRKENLVAYANAQGVSLVEVFDMERLRHVLDCPEGLIARLQYLDISMTATEQASLVGKFGNQLQHAVTARFDRVERTLAQMERFLQFQKPILRLDIYIETVDSTASVPLGEEAVLLCVEGMYDLSDKMWFIVMNRPDHKLADSALISQAQVWKDNSEPLTLGPCIGHHGVLVSYNELSLTQGGHRVRIADLTALNIEVVCTKAIHDRITRIAVDANGYELFAHGRESATPVATPQVPDKVTFPASSREWVTLVARKKHNFLFDPPQVSGRLQPIQQNRY